MEKPAVISSPREKTQSSTDWNEFWTKRLCAAARKEGLNEKETAWEEIIQEYLTKNPYVPSRVYVARMISFLESIPQSSRIEAARCMYFFYDKVHPSKEHRDIAEKIGRQAASAGHKGLSPEMTGEKASELKPSADDAISSIEHRLAVELKARNYSRHTMKNYGAIARNYVSWLGTRPTAKVGERIKRFQIFLKEEKRYSPKTVNLATAAILFLYNIVLDIPLRTESLPNENRPFAAESVFV